MINFQSIFGKKIIITALVVLALVGITYVVKPKPLPPQQALYPVSEELRGETVLLQDYVRYPGREGSSAFELLEEAAGGNIEAEHYDFGVFVKSINGVEPDGEHFWKLYVNGGESQVGADQLTTRDGDTIEWVLEKIKGGEEE